MREHHTWNALHVIHRLKGIPYGPAGRERSTNHGFVPLKGKLEGIDQLPEVIEDPSLAPLLRAINAKDSEFFSVGCVSGRSNDARGHSVSGYVEFTINSLSRIADARNYFTTFFWFEQSLHKSGFEAPVKFNWELAPAAFLDAKPTANGFTCSLFINTEHLESADIAEAAWIDALEMLTVYFSGYPRESQDPIY